MSARYRQKDRDNDPSRNRERDRDEIPSAERKVDEGQRCDAEQIVGRSRKVLVHGLFSFWKRAASIALLSVVVATAIHITPAEAARLTPSIRSSNVTYTAGAHSISVSVPAGTTSALIGFCYYNDTGPESSVRMSSVSLDGQAAQYITGAGTASSPTTTFTGLYKVTGFGTGAGKTLSYTVPATGTDFAMSIGVEFRDGSLTFGTTGAASAAASSQASPGPASTSGINNTAGDEFVAFYCTKDDFGSPPAVGTGQTKEDETDDTTGRVYYGFSTEPATGAADVQTIGAGGTANLPSIAAVAVTTTVNVSFTVAPVYATVSNTAISATFTASMAALTYECALYAPGATAPTAAQILAGTGAHSAVISGSTTGSSESHNMTASDSPTFPMYDPYCVLYNGATPGTVATTSQTQTTPPTTCGAALNQPCQYVQLSSVAIGGVASVAALAYDGQTANFVVGETVTGGTSGAVALVQSDSDGGAAGTLTLWVASGTFQDNEAITGNVNGAAVVNGTATYIYAANDVLVAPTYPSPAGASYPLTILADGTAIYDAYAYDLNVGREIAMNIKVYDYLAVGYASSDIDWVNNNNPPTCPGDAIPENLVKNQAITSFDWDTLCTDVEGDTLNSIAVGTQPTGISLNGTTNVVSGTPTVVNTGVTVKYVVYDIYGALGFRPVVYTVVSLVYKQTPDCVTTATGLSFCESLYETALLDDVTFTESAHCSNHVDDGDVISTSPAPLAQVPTGSKISIKYSTGTCADAQPSVNCLGSTPSACQTLITARFGSGVTLHSTITCPTVGNYANDQIYSQSPAVGHPMSAPDDMYVRYCH